MKSNEIFNFFNWIVLLAIGTMMILTWFISDMKIKIAVILSFVTAPFYAIANFVLITSKHTPKEHQPKLPLRILSVVGILFLIGFTVCFILSLV